MVDVCWFDPQRDGAGNLRADPVKFPSGMKALGDYIDGKGLKFGICQVPGERTCTQATGGYPGSTGGRGHEAQDAATFASWGRRLPQVRLVFVERYPWRAGRAVHAHA